MEGGISIVIATRDRPRLLERSLAEAVRRARPEDEIVVVDSASAPGAVAAVTGRYPAVRLVRVEQPGTSRARNAGWRAATREIVAFVDDDCLPSEGWAEAVERAFADRRVGFATGRVVADREVSLGVSLLLDEEPRRFDAPADPASYGHGSNMAFRREALSSVGGFDESLGPGAPLRAAEDQDLFWRLARAGWAGVYEPRATVTHLQWRGRGPAVARHLAYGVGAGAVAVKMIRAGDPLGRRALRRHLWEEGVLLFVRSLLRGHKSPAAASILKVAGVMLGALRAMVVPLRGDLFAASDCRGSPG